MSGRRVSIEDQLMYPHQELLMYRLVIALLIVSAVASCGSPTSPAGISVDVTSATRPTTSFVVRNNTGANVQLVSSAGVIGHAVNVAPPDRIFVCTAPFTQVTVATGSSVSSTAETPSAGEYTIVVTLADNTTRSSGAFTIR